MGERLQVDLDADAMGGMAGRNRPHVLIVSKLMLGTVKHFQDHRRDLLECKVEKHLHDCGHEVPWTPPCCRDLQAI
jgi:hypothetical protein